jgi:chaperone required for assembly of F1-ATPase
MRDILEDAEGAAARGDIGPGKANRERDLQKFPKKFYEKADIKEQEDGFSIELDGRPVKTPGKQVLKLPGSTSAQIVADEWNAAEEVINPLKMPATRLANTAIDGVVNEMQAVMEDITRYAGSDLVCYRAANPQGLVEKQREHWDPILDWALSELGANFETGEGIAFVTQPKESIALFGARLKNHADPFKLASIHTFTSISGSALIALALADEHLDAETAWAAAHVDEDWNIAQWGEDFEAQERRAQKWIDFSTADKLLKAVSKEI